MSKFQPSISVVTHNRENRIECSLQAFIQTLIKSSFLLEKFSVRLQLGSQQIWHFQHTITLSKALSDTFFFSN